MAREHEQWIDRLLAEIPDDEVDRLASLLADLKHGTEAEAERAR